MQLNNKMASQKIYRFKFRQDFLDVLVEFSRIHQFDDTKTFKEAFETFCKDKKELVDKETKYLNTLGYQGNVTKKIYISARYYFKNKDYNPQEKKKDRRKYISQDKDFICSIDEHVIIAIRKNEKPAEAFSKFNENFENIVSNEKNRLKEFLNSEEKILNKIKKTYKNRYFIQQKYTNQYA